MINAFALSIAQLGDRPILKVIAQSIALTLAIFAALLAGLWMALDGLDPCGWFGWLGWSGNCAIEDGIAAVAAALLVVAALWFLFPAVAIGVTSLFSDRIVDCVEATHYPGIRASRQLGWAETIGLALASAGRLILWNVIAIPGYLLLMFTGIGPFILFLAINALALGRDLGDMVAVRHLDGPSRASWRGRTIGVRALLGVIVAGLFMIPIVNLLAPIIGAAMATHVFHRTRATL